MACVHRALAERCDTSACVAASEKEKGNSTDLDVERSWAFAAAAVAEEWQPG